MKLEGFGGTVWQQNDTKAVFFGFPNDHQKPQKKKTNC